MDDLFALHLDGYRVEVVPEADAYSLRIYAVAGGERLEPDHIELLRTTNTDEGRADACRAMYLLAALCRFRNAGGELVQMAQLCQRFFRTIADGARFGDDTEGTLPSLALPPEIRLCFVLESTDHTRVFKTPDGYLRVVEDSFAEEMSEADAIALLDEDRET